MHDSTTILAMAELLIEWAAKTAAEAGPAIFHTKEEPNFLSGVY